MEQAEEDRIVFSIARERASEASSLRTIGVFGLLSVSSQYAISTLGLLNAGWNDSILGAVWFMGSAFGTFGICTLLDKLPIGAGRRVELTIAQSSIAIQDRTIDLATHRVRIERSMLEETGILIIESNHRSTRSTHKAWKRLVLDPDQFHRIQQLLIQAHRNAGSPAVIPVQMQALQQDTQRR